MVQGPKDSSYDTSQTSASLYSGDLMPNLPSVSQNDDGSHDNAVIASDGVDCCEGECITILSSYLKSVVGEKDPTPSSPWKADKPFDEESILSELGEGAETIYDASSELTNEKSVLDYLQIHFQSNPAEPQELLEKEMGTAADGRKSGWTIIACLAVSMILAIVVVLAITVDSQSGGRQVSQALGSPPSNSTDPNSGAAENPPSPNLTEIDPSPPSLNPTETDTSPNPTETDTSAPTSAPSSNPTRSPTTSPTPGTPAPTDCKNEINVKNVCYEPDEVITVEVIVCDPRRWDWLAIYSEQDAEDPLRLSDDGAVAWAYTCGGRSGCWETVKRGRVSFAPPKNARPAQQFRAFLFAGTQMEEPYRSMAMSDAFVISEDCET